MDDVIDLMLYQVKGILELELDTTKGLMTLLDPLSKLDGCLAVVDALQVFVAFAVELEQQSSIASANIEYARTFLISRDWVVLLNVLDSLLLHILSKPNFAVVSYLFKVLQLHLEVLLPVLLPRKLGLIVF